jgi:hypothetical protein
VRSSSRFSLSCVSCAIEYSDGISVVMVRRRTQDTRVHRLGDDHQRLLWQASIATLTRIDAGEAVDQLVDVAMYMAGVRGARGLLPALA